MPQNRLYQQIYQETSRQDIQYFISVMEKFHLLKLYVHVWNIIYKTVQFIIPR